MTAGHRCRKQSWHASHRENISCCERISQATHIAVHNEQQCYDDACNNDAGSHAISLNSGAGSWEYEICGLPVLPTCEPDDEPISNQFCAVFRPGWKVPFVESSRVAVTAVQLKATTQPQPCQHSGNGHQSVCHTMRRHSMLPMFEAGS